MSEKSDDIKQLFSHLGLNPSDYQEIRSAPSSGATMTEAPRRWSLLQAIGSPAAVPSRATPSVPPAPRPPSPSQWAEILPGLGTAPAEPAAATPAPVTSSSPIPEGLSSLFQAVRETQMPPAAPPPAIEEAPALTGDQAADRLYRELRSSAQTLAARNPPPPPVTPPWAGYDPDLETRHVAVPAQPVRVAVPPPPAVPATGTVPATPTRVVIPPDAPDPQLAPPPPPRPAPPPVVATPIAAPAPAPARPAPRPAVAEAKPVPPPPAPVVRPAASSATASTGLQAAFRRLSEPEPPRAAGSGRLRLNYQLPHTSPAGTSKDERLGDVLKRISGHNGSTR